MIVFLRTFSVYLTMLFGTNSLNLFLRELFQPNSLVMFHITDVPLDSKSYRFFFSRSMDCGLKKPSISFVFATRSVDDAVSLGEISVSLLL